MLLDLSVLTTKELRAQLADLKALLMSRIAAHFEAHPAAVNKPDPNAPGEWLQLLPYHVQTTQSSTAFLTQLRATGFAAENEFGEADHDDYEVLSAEELVDVLSVLDAHPAEVA